MTTNFHKWLSPSHFDLKVGDVHLWHVKLDTAVRQAQSLYKLLAVEEINRLQTYYFSRDRERFATVRGILRILLGAYVKISPDQIVFHYTAYGKPILASNSIDHPLNFNISHSHDLALLAFAQNRSIGVDVEYILSEIVREQIAECFFSPQEIVSLRTLTDQLQPIGFFNCWTRKEAFIKATGQGLSRSLDEFSVSLVPGEPARLLEINGDLQEPSNWLIQDVNLGSEYAAALVVQRPVNRIYNWEIDHAFLDCPHL